MIEQILGIIIAFFGVLITAGFIYLMHLYIRDVDYGRIRYLLAALLSWFVLMGIGITTLGVVLTIGI